MTPGPCPVPPEVGLALARPVIHHRSDEFHVIHEEVTRGLRRLFGTAGDVFITAGSGTAAMESAVVNTLSPGDPAIVIRGGKFAERWQAICEAFGARVIPIEVDWGRAVEPERVRAELAENAGAGAVFATLFETSTAVKTDIESLARITRESDSILVVDAISSLGCAEFRMDDWGVDVAVAAGQKGLMVPTGLALAAVNGPKAWAAVERSTMPKYYFDWKAARAAADRHETAWSAPASLIAGLRESIGLILEEGLDNVIVRHARLARACRAGVTALGLELLAPDAPAEGLTGIRVPEGISAEDLRDRMERACGVQVAGGQQRLKGKVIRIAHMGYADGFDVIAAVAALEMALAALGHPVEQGKGVTAAMKQLTTD